MFSSDTVHKPLTLEGDATICHLTVFWQTKAFVASFVDAMWNVAELLSAEELSGVPLVVLHGDSDGIVPRAQGEEILERAAAVRKLGVWVERADHDVGTE